MEFTNDIVDHNAQGDNEIFSLNKIKTKKQLLELQTALPGLEISDDDDEEAEPKFKSKKKMLFSKFDANNEDEFEKDDDQEDDTDPEYENDSEQEDINNYSDEDVEKNPLLNDLSEPTTDKKSAKSNLWFNKEAFDFLKDSDEQNQELLKEIEMEDENEKVDEKKPKKGKFDSDSDSESDVEGDADSEDEGEKKGKSVLKAGEDKENDSKKSKHLKKFETLKILLFVF